MNPRIIIHRAGSLLHTSNAIDELIRYASIGFVNLEFDITILESGGFKLCHPSDLHKVSEIYYDLVEVFDKLSNKCPQVTWFLDIKYLSNTEFPFKIIDVAKSKFGHSLVLTAAESDLLEYAHLKEVRTGQFFREGIENTLSFTSDFVIIKSTNSIEAEKTKTILHCNSIKEANEKLNEDYAFVMIDADNIQQTNLLMDK